jgi:hypothetical protein
VCVVVLAAGLLAFPAVAAPREIVRVGDCLLEAPPSGARALAALAPQVPGLLARSEGELGVSARRPFRVILLPAEAVQDSEWLKLDRGAPEWAAGYAVTGLRVAVIRLAQARRYPYGTPATVFAHESAHLLLHDAVGDRLPRWFEEGVATWVAREWRMEDVLIVTARFLTEDLPRFEDMDRSFQSTAAAAEEAYAASFAFVSWSERRYGPGFLREVLRRAGSEPFGRAWRGASGVDLERSEGEWRRESLFRFRWIPILTASSTLWIGIVVLALVAWTRSRRRAMRLRQTWEREEPEEWYEQAVEATDEAPGASSASGEVREGGQGHAEAPRGRQEEPQP